MASLLYPDDDRSQWPTSLLPVDDGTPPVLQADPRADALGQTYRDVSDYLARQQAKSEAEGYWTGGGLLEGGHPTQKGLLDAIQQTGTAVALGTSAPGDAPPPGFTAYHGSPHSFDAFDLSKIGTGEGAQAYGHGMYLADAEGVARTYRDMAAKPLSNPVNDTASAWLKDAGGDADKAVAAFSDFAKQSGLRADEIAEQTAAIHNVANAPRGHMYEVQVNADPAHFLDWDRPLGEQHPNVQAALASIKPGDVGLTPVQTANGIRHVTSQGFEVGPRIYDKAPGDISLLDIAGDRGMSAVENLANWTGGHANASELLQKAGIPGIRYLDAGSRGAGEGSRNSVVFDAANMEIIRKYGLAGLMAGGGAAALSGQQGQQQQ